MREQSFIITADDLRAELAGASKPVLLDVREQEEFDEVHIEGCHLIPLGEVLTRVEKEMNKEDDIVVYCAHGVRSMHALRAMHQMGFKKLRSLSGGIAEWLGDPNF